MQKEVLNWLLSGPAYVKYAVNTQLLKKDDNISVVLNDPRIKKIVSELKNDEQGLPALKTGKIYYTKAGSVYWMLFFIADIGLNINDIGLTAEVDEFLNSYNDNGYYVSQDNIKESYFCIPTIIVSSLARMGLKDDSRILNYRNLIIAKQRLDGGWHCAKRRAIGQSLQHTDSCVMDNLNILMFCANYNNLTTDRRFNGAIDLLLKHWQLKEEHWRPYGFGVGKQFKQLKYPAIKYGILRVLDVLAQYPYAVKHEMFQEMLDYVNDKSDNGRYYAESVSKTFTGFDFGQKKEPSKFITFLINRINQRAGL